jgi:hypothetical protein
MAIPNTEKRRSLDDMALYGRMMVLLVLELGGLGQGRVRGYASVNVVSVVSLDPPIGTYSVPAHGG